jgi:hypothetical protein
MIGRNCATLPQAAPTFEKRSFGWPSLTCLIHTRSDIISGTSMSESNLPEWEQLLSAAAHLQEILPDVLGSLDGIETGVRQLIRQQPLEIQEVTIGDVRLVVPTEAELLRIKGVLILRRNATRDYLDFAALADRIGPARVMEALAPLDQLYPQPSGESALQQLQIQLSNPMPYDLEDTDLSEYRKLQPKWHDWNLVKEICVAIAVDLFSRL